MTLLLKFIKKTKSHWVVTILTLIAQLNDLACMIGFFVVPFIKYPESKRVAFLVLWWYVAVVFLVLMVDSYRNNLKTNPKEIEAYQKDKIVYNVGRFGILIYLLAFFSTVFLGRNGFLKLSWFSIITIAILGILLLSITLSLLTQYKNNYLKMAKDTANFLLFFSIVVFSSIIMLVGVLYHGNESLPQYLSEFMVGLGAVPLLSMGIYWVCKMFLSEKMLKEDSDILPNSVILFIVIGFVNCILLRYAIKDDKLQEIMTTISAAILGGAITLAGVAWTIKKGDMDRQAEINKIECDRKEDDRKKNKPYLCIDTTGNAKIKIVLNPPSGYNLSIQLLTDSIFIFKGIMADGNFLESEKLIPQKESFHIELNINDYENVSLVGCDVLDNYYKFDLEFYVRNNTKFVKSIHLPKEIDIKDIQF